MESYENPWIYQGEPVLELPENCVGFVYVLTAPDGVGYVGKKISTATKYKVVKGKKKKIKGDSNWKSYYGSSEQFVQRVQDCKLQTKREILHFCFSKAEMGYLEAKEQFNRDVLLTNDYDNGWIMCRVTKPHLAKYRERKNEKNSESKETNQSTEQEQDN